VIVLGGTSGKRVALPHAKILLNQVSRGFEDAVAPGKGTASRDQGLGRLRAA
jgi:ATP-dependent protease ClpP protease subunit